MGNIGQYMIRRVLLLIPLLIGLSLVMFLLIHLAPGDPVRAFISQPGIDPTFIAQARHNLGLDQPLPIQYARYMGRLVRGDFGTAYTFNSKPVLSLIGSRVGATVILQGISLAIALLIAIPLGILSATKQYSLLDNTTTVGSFIGLAIPNFWLALLLQLYLSVKFHWLPTISTGQAQAPFPARIKYFVMPVIVLALPSIAYFARFMRSAMLEVMRQDYMTSARAKGLSNRAVLYRHGLRNALVPMVTVSGLQISQILGGAVIIEQIFAWPGLGLLAYDAITRRDYPVILGVTMCAGIFVMVVNILIDFVYVLVDPRVSLTGQSAAGG
ncbi:MAG TPA: ABC transporter permease [Thermomicrobiales bacterium]